MSKIKLLIAPNSFKECADAIEIATEIKEHFGEEDYEIKSIPISDGGDGFLKICEKIFPLKIETKETNSFYDGRIFQIPIGISSDLKKMYIESAEVIGMKKVPTALRNPLTLHSNNFGNLLLKLEDEYLEVSKIIIGLGGTATNDLGLGLCVPFGLKLFDSQGNELPVEPKYFVEVDSITLPAKQFSIPLEVVTDVKVPLYGQTGTSKTFAKQKGATEIEIGILEKGVLNIISILNNKHGLDYSTKLYGAGGGLLLGLSLISNPLVYFAEDFLLNQLKIEEELLKSDFIITGEGIYDEQSMMNKGTGIIVQLAQKHKKKLFLICGSLKPSDAFLNNEEIRVFSLEEYFRTRRDSLKNYKMGIEKACGEIKSYILSHS